jgi:hypothetical protein
MTRFADRKLTLAEAKHRLTIKDLCVNWEAISAIGQPSPVMADGAVYEVRPRKDHRGVDLISDALPFGRLWYGGLVAVSNAIGYAQHYSRSEGAVIRVTMPLAM